MNISPPEDTLAPLDLSERPSKIRSKLPEGTALVVTDSSNIQWLTGFTGSNGTVYMDHEDFLLITDKRYQEQAPQQISEVQASAEITVSQDPINVISKSSRRKTIHIDPTLVTWERHQRLAEGIEGEINPSSPLKELRAQKDKGEIERIALAARIVDLALQETIPLLECRMSEMEIAAHLDYKIRALGASGNAYQTIVASGANSAIPHAQPSTKTVDEGDLVIIDVGAVVDGYRSDMTRTFVIGEPDEQQQKYLAAVSEAQRETVQKLKPGVPCAELDRYCREKIEEAGWGEHFIHGTGHGVGLDIHESPMINSKSEDILLSGMIITIEPGIYFTDSCGVRWEDLFEITESGARQLTLSAKSPRV